MKLNKVIFKGVEERLTAAGAVFHVMMLSFLTLTSKGFNEAVASAPIKEGLLEAAQSINVGTEFPGTIVRVNTEPRSWEAPDGTTHNVDWGWQYQAPGELLPAYEPSNSEAAMNEPISAEVSTTAAE